MRFRNLEEARSHYLSLSEEERRDTDYTSKVIWEIAKIPPLYLSLIPERDWKGDSVAIAAIEQYLLSLGNSGKKGLFLFGSHGTGKTFLASYVLREAIRSYDHRIPPMFSGFFCSFGDLVGLHISSWESQEMREIFREKLLQTDIVLLDDVGREYQSRSNLNRVALEDLIRERVYHGKINLLTTNKTPDELEILYGKGIVSMIWESSVRINVMGEDYRFQEES